MNLRPETWAKDPVSKQNLKKRREGRMEGQREKGGGNLDSSSYTRLLTDVCN